MSERPREPLFRTARAIVFATACVALAVLGHVLAGGASVPVWAGMAGFGAVLGVTLMLAGHERSLATILGGLLGGQFALHTLFTAAAPHAPLPMPAMADHAAGADTSAMHTSAMHASAMHTAMSAGADTMAASAPHDPNGLVMTLAHCVAALVAAWWLRRGEQAAWAMARRVAAAADRPVRLLLALLSIEPAPSPRPVPVLPAADAATALGRVLRHQVVERGPPARSRALAHSC